MSAVHVMQTAVVVSPGGRYECSMDAGLPRRTARRMSTLSCMAVRAAREAGGEELPPAAPLVFATANGEFNIIGEILEILHEPRPGIPASRFLNSVHNAPAGYWGILAKRRAAVQVVSRAELSFEMALLEAWCWLSVGETDVLVVAGDEAVEVGPWGDPDHSGVDLCVALRLSTRRDDGTPLARIEAVDHASVGTLEGARREMERQRLRYGPVRVVADLACLGGEAGPDLPGDADHPCGAAYHLVEALGDLPADRRCMFFKAGRDGCVLTIVVGR